MFRSLGLFNSTKCPDEPCYRPYCFFGHSQSTLTAGPSRPPARATSSAAATSGAAKRKVPPDETLQSKRAALNPTHSPTPLASSRDGGFAADRKDVKTGDRAAVTSSANSVVKGSAPLASKAQATIPPKQRVQAQPAVRSATPIATQASGAPILPRDAETLKKSPQPYADRQKSLNTLYTQYAKVYLQLATSHPSLAAESALAQEKEISHEALNVTSYKRAIHHAAVSIMRRPPADTINHPSVGTLRESRIKVDQALKDAQSRLSFASCIRYCLATSDFALWGYPEPDGPSYENGDSEPDAAGTQKTCERCQAVFIVSADDKERRMGECCFHFGRLQPERMEGKRQWIYTCCNRERGGAGCQDGLHCFSEKADDEALHRRVAYKTVKTQCEENAKGKMAKGWLEVVGIDCEMIYTTAGLSLARATVTDEKGEVILDELVRQKAGIIDANSRFSGLTEDDLEKAVMDLAAVRAAVCMFIGPDTIIVGHGLENDLRALRLLHDKVIDTATLFPHPKGPPFRRALRDLVKEKLGYFIQERTSDKGHSSAEDAQATLEVLKWKSTNPAEPMVWNRRAYVLSYDAAGPAK